MKILILSIASILLINYSFAQTAPGPVERKLTDSICSCVTQLDLSKITTKQQAIEAYTNCILRKSDMLIDLAAEKNVEMTDTKAMEKIGADIAIILIKEKCPNFLKLSTLFAGQTNSAESGSAESTQGILKRIDNKGFNYIVLTDNNNSEKSFIWLRQFPGSEKFMDGIGTLAGKKVKIIWSELEVYLPSAKGYYKIKEITGIEIL